MKFRVALILGMLALSLCAIADQAEQVEELLAMSPTDRRAALQAIPASERNGLWFAVKKAQHERRNSQSGAKSRSNDPAGKIGYDTRITKPRTGGGNKAIGSIQYDDSVVTGGLGGNTIVGNRFDTHTGIPVFANGTVTSVQAVVVAGSAQTTSSAGFVMLGPQNTMGGAMALFSTFTAGLTGSTDTVTFTGLNVNYTGSSYFVLFGDFVSVYIPAFGTGTANGQGFHGVLGLTGGMGPTITATSPVAGRNSLIRTTGNIVPVELMQFTVD